MKSILETNSEVIEGPRKIEQLKERGVRFYRTKQYRFPIENGVL